MSVGFGDWPHIILDAKHLMELALESLRLTSCALTLGRLQVVSKVTIQTSCSLANLTVWSQKTP